MILADLACGLTLATLTVLLFRLSHEEARR